LTAVLTFTGGGPLTLEVDDAVGPIARVSGRSPLRLAALVDSGKHKFVVSGPSAGATFALAANVQHP
jgi:hypothetical protein